MRSFFIIAVVQIRNDAVRIRVRIENETRYFPALVYHLFRFIDDPHDDRIVRNGVGDVKCVEIDSGERQEGQVTAYYPRVGGVIIAVHRFAPEIALSGGGNFIVRLEHDIEPVLHRKDLAYVVDLIPAVLPERQKVENTDVALFIAFLPGTRAERTFELVNAYNRIHRVSVLVVLRRCDAVNDFHSEFLLFSVFIRTAVFISAA